MCVLRTIQDIHFTVANGSTTPEAYAADVQRARVTQLQLLADVKPTGESARQHLRTAHQRSQLAAAAAGTAER